MKALKIFDMKDNGAHGYTEGANYTTEEQYGMVSPKLKREETYLDLSKCTEEQQKHVFSLLPTEKDLGDYTVDQDFKYLNFDIPMDRWFVDNNEYENKTELTYPEFIKLFEGVEEAKTSLQIAVKALENIINPIGYMKSQLEEGDTFNGYAAVMIAEKPQFYQNIAKEALEKINSNQ